VGTIGTIAKIAEKVPAIGKFAPGINGMGDLYEDEDGNIVDMGGLNGDEYYDDELEGLAGQPQLVQDDNGQTYMIEGLAGDEYYDDELEGLAGEFEDDLVIGGLAGNKMMDLIAA